MKGYGDLGANHDGDSETPNLDRLAMDGIRFTDMVFSVIHSFF